MNTKKNGKKEQDPVKELALLKRRLAKANKEIELYKFLLDNSEEAFSHWKERHRTLEIVCESLKLSFGSLERSCQYYKEQAEKARDNAGGITKHKRHMIALKEKIQDGPVLLSDGDGFPMENVNYWTNTHLSN